MIEGFGLPEFGIRPAENFICFVSGIALDRFRDLSERRTRLDQDVDVIGHHYVRVDAKHFEMVSSFQRGDDAFGDARIFKPKRAGSRAIQMPIVAAELLANGIFFFGEFETGWKGTA